jgi:hypothetical protein
MNQLTGIPPGGDPGGFLGYPKAINIAPTMRVRDRNAKARAMVTWML